MFAPLTGRARLFLLLALLAALTTAAGQHSAAPPAAAQAGPGLIVSVESLGLVTFATGTIFAGTEVGGLSAVTYDAARGVYYVLSDDRSEINPARYYTVGVDLGDGSLDPGDVAFQAVTFLKQKNGDAYPPFSLDPEGAYLLRPGQLYISSEGNADGAPPLDPFVNRFNPDGKLNRELTIPAKFLPDGAETFGVRDNLAFESLTAAPDGRKLATATENALHQDGPASSLTDSSPSRLLEFELGSKRPAREFVYCVEPIPQAPIPPGAFADNGLSEMQALDNQGTFLAMERSFAVGVGNTVILYETSSQGATDVSAIEALGLSGCPAGAITPMSKSLVADFEQDLGLDPDNLEGMAFGPALPDGRLVLLVVSDNNFNPSQTTQFIALAVEFAP
ncbi:MAG: esterase-like activity of phytase family protein [Candidatus Promineifilaceae bacterium]